MLEAFQITHLHDGDETLAVVLTFEERQKSRHRTLTSCGKTLGWFVERGRVLQQDDVLKCKDGTLIKVIAAAEDVSNVVAPSPLLLMRAAYHLGNRHVPLQVEQNFLRYQQDHVLDAMVEGLGLTVEHAQLPFHPENGAYSGGHSHAHAHSHSHAEAHTHEH
ncbi:Urease accessory protein UreE [Thalassocella blandensis]|nr:Urease accessory protein UreE [Thalassocella blandensis]